MMRLPAIFVLVAAAFGVSQTAPRVPPASGTQAMYEAAAAGAARKFQYIQENARRSQPAQNPTSFTEREINAYLASGRVRLPKGVRSVRLTGDPGIVRANARVDFDAITASRRSSNPFLVLFSGVHDVDVMAHAVGRGQKGFVQIDSAAIDGVTVPRMALEFFINRYIKPKHPTLGMDSVFPLPNRVDNASIGAHTLTLTQK
jgi:hypothetical protein